MHEASFTTPKIEVHPQIIDEMIRVQQVLLNDGYLPVAGDADTWPVSDVIYRKEHRRVYLAIWEPDRNYLLQSHLLHYTDHERDIGLLLIGAEPPHDILITEFIFKMRGREPIAYVDVVSRRMIVRGGSSIIQNIPSFFRKRRLVNLLDRAKVIVPAPEIIRNALRASGSEPVSSPALIRNEKPTEAQRCWFTYALIVICCAIYALTLLRGDGHIFGGPSLRSLIYWGALNGGFIANGEWWRLISSAFLHGFLWHLTSNMSAALAFIPLLEEWQGRWRIMALYLYSAITGSICSLWWHPAVVSVGASGALYGMLGVYLALLIRHRNTFQSGFRVRFYIRLISLLIVNLLISLLPMINLAAHLGGLVGGLVLGLIITRPPLSSVPLSRREWGLTALVLLLTAGCFALNLFTAR